MTRGDSDRGGVTDGYIFTVPKWHNHVFYWIPRRLSPTIVACMSMVTKVFCAAVRIDVATSVMTE